MKATECFSGKMAGINVGPSHPTLMRSPPSFEPATQQTLFTYEAETILTDGRNKLIEIFFNITVSIINSLTSNPFLTEN